MSDLIRDAPIGQIIRLITKNKVLQYPEEKESFTTSAAYASVISKERRLPPTLETDEETVNSEGPPVEEVVPPEPEVDEDRSENEDQTPGYDTEKSDLEKIDTVKSAHHKARQVGPAIDQVKTAQSGRSAHTMRTQLSRVGTKTALKNSVTHADLEEQFALAAMETPRMILEPEVLEDGTILVDWYSTDDPENPQNWSFGKKTFVSTLIYAYTFAVYMGSAIYAPSEEGVVRRFGVSIDAASLGLSMYVLAYGIGPLLFSPLSEIPVIGRNIPYLITYFLYVVLLVPAALVDNFAGLIVLRFLQGFFGSPCLATGGATLQDMFSIIKLPYALSLWTFAATCGPALGPIISGFSVQAENWRWSLWEMLWLNGPILILLFLFLPETSTANILLRRAQRLRKLTGDNRPKAQSEIDQAKLTTREIVNEALWRPMQLMLLDPSIAFTAVYTALIYGIYYSFFEAFPLVYIGMYGFNLGEMGLTFLSITVGVLISLAAYWSYVYYKVEPEIRNFGLGAPERRLIPGLFVTFLIPIGLFIFAWTANPDIHWIVTVIGICINTIGVFLIFQCIFLYLPLSYPQYAASLFAGNDFTRSTLAAGSIHFARPLFNNLGVGKGISLLAALTAGCCVGVYILYFYGAKLRAQSRFAAK